MKKENDVKGGFKYLIKDTEVNSFLTSSGCATHSNDIGECIHNNLPHYISEEGDCDTEVIRSDNPRFNEILIKGASNLEKSIDENQSELDRINKNIKLLKDAWNCDSKKYLIRSRENSYFYLQANSLGIYGRDIGLAIHDELPSYVTNKNDKIIDSDSPEFKEILKESYNGPGRENGLEKSAGHYGWLLEEDRENFNIISKTLGSKLRKI